MAHPKEHRHREVGHRVERIRQAQPQPQPRPQQQLAATNLIPVGKITVDCTPVTFESPGMVRSIVSCAVDQVVVVPVTHTVDVQTPIGGGCFLCTPVVKTIFVPVVTTVNVPPVLTPVPTIFCPPTAQSPVGQTCPCPCPCPCPH